MKSSLFTTTTPKYSTTQTFCCISYLVASGAEANSFGMQVTFIVGIFLWQRRKKYWPHSGWKTSPKSLILSQFSLIFSSKKSNLKSVWNNFTFYRQNFWNTVTRSDDTICISKTSILFLRSKKLDIFFCPAPIVSIVTFACKPNFFTLRSIKVYRIMSTAPFMVALMTFIGSWLVLLFFLLLYWLCVSLLRWSNSTS